MSVLVVLIVEALELDGSRVSAVLVDCPVVEPVDPFQGRDLDLVAGAPGAGSGAREQNL